MPRTCSKKCFHILMQQPRISRRKRPFKLKCEICGKFFETMLYNKRTCSKKCSSKLKSIVRKQSPKVQAIFKNPEFIKKQKMAQTGLTRNREEHERAVKEEKIKLEQGGYKCIETDKIRPDILAFKNGKIYAYEIEFGNPNYEKYNNCSFFDDIIWIKKENNKKIEKKNYEKMEGK